MRTFALQVIAISVIIFALITSTVALAQTAPKQTPDPLTTSPAAEETTSGASPHKSSYSVEVAGTKQWVDTNIDLRRCEKLQITAGGTITYSDAKKNHFGPAGIPRSFADLIHQYAVPNGSHGELIGRLGSGDAAEPFEVGASSTYTAPVAGRLFLGINQSLKDGESATGSFQVKIDVASEGLGTADATMVGGPAESPLPAITAKLLESIPRMRTMS